MTRTRKVILMTGLIAVASTAAVQAATGVVFRDKFDGYANDAEMTITWPNWSGTLSGALDTTIFYSSPKALFHPASPGANRYHVFADATTALVATDANPILWKFMFYDQAGAGNTRKTGSLLTSPNWNATSDKWLEFGAYGLTSQTQYCIRTVNLSGPNWVVYPGSARSVAWHTMRVEIGATYVKYTLDALAPYQVAINAANVKWTTVACGGPSNLSSGAGSANYDDVHVSYVVDENAVPGCGDVPAVSIDEVLLSGATTVNVSSVNPAATKVTVYKSSTGTAPWTEIGNSTATPFASTVAVTVAPLVAGDTIVATQTMIVTVNGFPPQPLESCQIAQPNRQVDYCGQIATPTLVGLVDAGRTSVLVKNVNTAATKVTVYDFAPGTPPTLVGPIGSNTSPGGASQVNVTVTSLVQGHIIRATQTVLGIEGCVPSSGGRTVSAAGIIEDFEGTVLRYDHPSPGVSGAWYDVSFQSYTDVLIPTQGRTTMPNGSKCLNVTDHGWTNGAYVIYEDVVPATGTYHLEMDMLIDEPADLDPDFYSSYQVGVIVNGTHRDPSAGIVPNITAPIGTYPCLTPLRDGVGSDPIKVYVDTFTANAGDDLLIAFSTNCNGYVRSKSATPAGYVGMKVDNIKLVEGPKPSICTDVPVAEILPTITTPLEAGGTKVTVRNIDPNATMLKVMSGTTVIGSTVPGGASEVAVDVTPLVAGDTILASQTVNGIESCQCPGATGPMVGQGRNSSLKIALGIRETGGTGPIGGNGGTAGNIEWVGATAKGTAGEPIGRQILTDPGWQTVTFRWPSAGGTDPVTGFTGNGVVDGTWGVLESLNFTIDSNNTGRYKIYIDTIMNGSTVIASFDTDAAGTLTCFRKPRNSGSTDMNLLGYPDIAEVSGAEAADGTNSYHVEWQYLDNAAKRWLRLTTVDDANSPDMPVQNPMIDLTQPVTVKLLIYGAPQCGTVFADSDADGDVDMNDFAAFQRCITAGTIPVQQGCECFDHPFNGIIGADDLTAFHNCASGPGIPATPGCGN